MSIFEAGMLFFFGLSWPISIYKSAKSRSTKGKSIVFLLLVLTGYFSGITHKIIYNPDIVLILYCTNAAMVAADTLLWLRNRRYEKTLEVAPSE